MSHGNPQVRASDNHGATSAAGGSGPILVPPTSRRADPDDDDDDGPAESLERTLLGQLDDEEEEEEEDPGRTPPRTTTTTTTRPSSSGQQELKEQDDWNSNQSNNNNNNKVAGEEDAAGEATTRPLCSVLNTVVDFVMMPPSPHFELEEFQQMQLQQQNQCSASSLLQVPVLRFFGPIVRHDDRRGGLAVDDAMDPSQQSTSSLASNHHHHPTLEDIAVAAVLPDPTTGSPMGPPQQQPPQQQSRQSACLHVHGAYPYLLARPVQAGPDGRGGPNDDDDDCPWDSPHRVQRMLPVLQEALEAALRDLVVTANHNQKNNTKNTATTTVVHRQILRRLTVVTGRGFYTYCPGPVAPFVRVEYYAPTDRWKIKRVLERGLSDLPHHCVPHPHVVSQPPQPNDIGNEEDDDLLRFHCYEAHIPYTMQFFKDWNLAGLSYLHVRAAHDGRVKFRAPLPTRARQYGCLQQRTRPHDNNHNNNEGASTSNAQSLFLASNTPHQYRWTPPTGEIPDEPTTHDNDDANDFPTKTTSCDVELDIAVQHILNVHDVIKELPQPSSSSVHWRSVPSLREIWNQERRRMARLLPPQQDFLSAASFLSSPPSHPKEPCFTLNVQRDAPLPGCRLAREGMRQLVQVTEGLEESFRRALRQIWQRHRSQVEHDDARAVRRLQQQQQSSIRHNDNNSHNENDDNDDDAFTPTHEEAMEALGELGNLFEAVDASQGNSDMDQEPDPNNNSLSQGSARSSSSRMGRFESLSQEFISSRPGNQERDEPYYSLHDEFGLSQRVERGEGIVLDGPFEHVDDVIDPETLVPYEAIDESDDNDEGPADDLKEDDDMNEQKFEQELATLATQTMANGLASRGYQFREEKSGDESSVESIELLARTRSLQYDEDDESDDADDALRSDPDRSSVAFHATSASSPTPLKIVAAELSPLLSDESSTFQSWEHPANISVSRREPPPTRGKLVNSAAVTTLFPKSTTGRNGVWTAFLADYERMYCRGSARSDWFPPTNERGVDVRPVRAPPSRKAVEAWHRKQTRKRKADAARNAASSKRCKSLNPRLDENSCKLNADSEPAPLDLEVEEVDWEPSQQGVLSEATQNGDLVAEPCSQPSRTSSSKKPCSQSSLASTSTGPTNDGITLTENPSPSRALRGIGNQGGRIWVEGGGQLKAKTKQTQTHVREHPDTKVHDTHAELPCPVTVMAIEVHIQCREGQAGVNDSRKIAMTPDSDRDRVLAVVCVFGRDSGGGEPFEFLERICVFVPLARELEKMLNPQGNPNLDSYSGLVRRSIPPTTMGIPMPFSVECVKDERQLLLRIASIVRMKDPDMLLSWDTQGAGLGYLIERGVALGKDTSRSGNGTTEVDMARLLGRTPRAQTISEPDRLGQLFRSDDVTGTALAGISNKGNNTKASEKWKGSGLGSEWDERVGAGAAAASITGRLVFAAWKIIAEEVKHPNCSYLPAVVWAVMNKRIPHHDNLKLAQWYGYDGGRERWRVIHHRLTQGVACLQLFDALDIIGRSGEAARLSGVEFSQSFPGIRGSQYKVEGVLLRALQSLNSDERGSKKGRKKLSADEALSGDSKSQTQSPWKARRFNVMEHPDTDCEAESMHRLSDRCYFFFSPSLEDTNKQEALESQALTLEPLSGHQQDPVVVCDFTALYPSLVIAYNLCYSTCAGKLDYHSTRNEMRLQGRTTGKVGPLEYSEERTATVLKHHMKSLRDDGSESTNRAYVAPTGTIFVSESVVKGVLPQVLDEMLCTRAMLKKASKQYKKLVPDLSPSILRQLEARQLALKYVANVTYGYTSATFSGRCAMPLLADTIVECGRRTLTKAINMANAWGRDPEGRWQNIEVIYGDTDSIFVKLPGRSVQEAFLFGEEFCKAVTDSNPPPVQLKLEKVYLGCMMQTKKKYCGMKFESKDQRKPEFEAKGLETIRRDQCALTQKVLRNSLVALYGSGIEAVKAYLFRQWALILSGRLPVSDFILTGRVRSRYRGGRVGPVQAVLARRLAEVDPGRVVRHKERQAYVIVATPGVAFKLQDCVLTPLELLEQWDSYTVHAGYYITKHVNAALQRCLGLDPYRVDVAAWFEASPKRRHRIHFWPSTRSKHSTMMISNFFGSDKCSLCGRKCTASGQGRAAICNDCRRYPVTALASAMKRLNLTQRSSLSLAQKCSACNLCFEDASTFAVTRAARSSSNSTSSLSRSSLSNILVTPLANCTCIDCPTTFERHRQREMELEATAVCEALNALKD